MNNRLIQSRAVAKKAFLASISVGITEILAGALSLSISLAADGLYSIATSVVFLIVWIGLRLSGKAPDRTFHFGYYRFETLGSLIAALILAAFGAMIIYESYIQWQESRTLLNSSLALVVALASAIIAIIITIYINRTAKKYRSISLKTGILNGALDVASSIVVLASIILNGYFGILYADAIGGLLIAFALFPAAYSIIRESSLVLVDACNCGDIVEAVTQVAKTFKEVKKVHTVRMRKLGPYIVGDMHIVVSGDMLVRDADLIASQVENEVKRIFGQIIDFKIRIESIESHEKHRLYERK